MTAVLRQLQRMRPLAFKCRSIYMTSMQSGKIVPYNLSDIGEGIHEVTVKEWFVNPGDRVSQFDNICEVQSDKASVTITSRYDGVVRTLHYNVDDTARVGNVLVDIELDDDEGDGDTIASKNLKNDDNVLNTNKNEGLIEQTNSGGKISTNTSKNKQSDTVLSNQKVLTTPAVRKLATEHNIDLTKVTPTGRDNRILKEDVLEYIKLTSNVDSVKLDTSFQKSEGQLVQLKRYTKYMYKSMTQSLSIPHFVYSDEFNVTKLLQMKNDLKEDNALQGIKLSVFPFFVKGVSKALKKFPELNAWLDESSESVRMFPYHNISIAVDSSEGLVVPNIKNVQNLNVVQIAAEIDRLKNLGVKGSFQISDLTDGTFALSNIGAVGGTYTKPVIFPPQVVIGALGRTQVLPRFDKEYRVIPASILSVSWAADHRVVDGATVAKFSNLLKEYIEKPTNLLVDI